MKCKCKKICRKSDAILSFSYQNIVTEGANMRLVISGQSMCAAMNVFFH